ncbi:hypothetical protein BDW66DRAFT_12589 [Aspergillus desertorum]
MKIFGESLLRRNETSSAEVLYTRTVNNGPTGIPSPVLDPRPSSPLILPANPTSLRYLLIFLAFLTGSFICFLSASHCDSSISPFTSFAVPLSTRKLRLDHSLQARIKPSGACRYLHSMYRKGPFKI